MLMDARAVQHESTATDADPGGRVRTLWDCDLHRDTRVDGLPLDGMQEVWGSNLHSSTGQRHNSKTRRLGTAAKYSSGERMRARTHLRVGPSYGAATAGMGCGSAEPRAASGAVTRMGSSSFALVTTWPRWRSGVRGAADPGLTLAAFADGQPAAGRAVCGLPCRSAMPPWCA
jgi:hypothetical protein